MTALLFLAMIAVVILLGVFIFVLVFTGGTSNDRLPLGIALLIGMTLALQRCLI